jgi:hypothetical protein
MMKPLISIETVPISIEYTTTKPQASKAGSQSVSAGYSQSARLRVSQQDNRLTIASNPIQIRMRDTFEQSSSSRMAYTATAEYSGGGLLSMNVQIQPGGGAPAQDAGQYRFQAAGGGIDRMVDALPTAPAPTVSAMPFIDMKIDFDMAHLAENQQLSESGMEASFIPPDLEIDIVEYPKVVIKYVGGPIYFPRSSDPNYEPLPHEHEEDAAGAGFDAKA